MAKKKIELRSGSLDYDTNAAGDESGLDCRFDLQTGEEIESMTKQEFAEECDINTIVRRFGLTQDEEMLRSTRIPEYGDYTAVTDYHTALNAVREAAENFMGMPAHVRSRFANDPQKFLEFVADGRNREEAQKMGLLIPQAAALAAKPDEKPTESPPKGGPTTEPAKPAAQSST